MTKNVVLNLWLCCSTIWRCRENCNIGAQLVPQMHNSPKDILKNLLPVWLLVRTNLFVPSHFWTTYSTKFNTCCLRYIVTCGKKIYRFTSTFSTLNYCGGTLKKKSLSYLYKVVHTNFSADFWTFRNFWQQFRENCGAKNETKMRTM